MQPTHLCKNSITLTNEQKQFAEQIYQPLLLQLKLAATTFPVKKNIYLGGSLALKEPALFCPQGKLKGVHSDLDIFVVAQSINDLTTLQKLPFLIENIYPELERSFHFSPLIKPIKNVYNIALEDLSFGINTPIIEEIKIDHTAYQYLPQSKSMAHYFISKLCSYCLSYRNTSHSYSNLKNNQAIRSTMDTIKLVLTGLRLQFYGIVENTHGIYSIQTLATQGYFEQIMTEADIIHWIFHREQYNPAATLPEINIPRFILDCWKTRLTLNKNATLEQIIQEVETAYFTENNILDKLALTLFTGCFYQLNSDPEYYHLFKHYLDQYYTMYSDPILKPHIINMLTDKTKQESILIKLYNHYLQSITNSIIPQQPKEKTTEATTNN